jgi:16S rRNA G966 N2-methylase RsmD
LVCGRALAVRLVAISDSCLGFLMEFSHPVGMHESEARAKESRSTKARLTLRPLTRVNNPKSIHGIYPYRGKMSPLDASHVVSQMPREATLLDPFCGTGTILYEAQVRGIRSVGVDNNPLACVIARGKTRPIDGHDTIACLESAISDAKRLDNTDLMSKWPARYFHPKTADQIMRVLKVSAAFDDYLQSAFYGTICLAARACNGWLWTSTSIGRINRPLQFVDFYAAFRRKSRKHLTFVKGHPEVTVYEADTREIQKTIPENSVDVVYTSPPYFDALDYTGYYTRLVMEIIGMDRAEVRSGLIQRYSTYKREMKTALDAIDGVLRNDALIIFVVGDKKIHGRLVRGADFFTEIAPWDSPYVVEREYTQTASGLWDQINDTRRREQVLVWDLSEGGR